MNRRIPLGRIFGLRLSARPTAVLSAIVMPVAITLVLLKLLKWRPGTAAAGGILATTLHFLSELWHQLGHASLAQQTGFPMRGISFVGPLALSQYPRNEGFLSAETHIQRALGGPFFSLLLTVAAGLVLLLTRPIGGLPLSLAAFTFFDNLLVFTLGALLPLGFTDGSTILIWWDRRRGARRVRI